METRITILSITFYKFVDEQLCCFFPGKVIDEIFTLLRNITKDENTQWSFESLQELRDISIMAIEYFNEEILPTISNNALDYRPSYSSLTIRSNNAVIHQPNEDVSLNNMDWSSNFLDCSPIKSPSSPSKLVENQLLETSKPNKNLYRSNKKLSNSCEKLNEREIMSKLKKEAEMYKKIVKDQNRKIAHMNKKIDKQNIIIQQQNEKLSKQGKKLAKIYKFYENGYR